MLDQPDWKDQILAVKLNRKQIKESPPLEDHAPVSKQYEAMMMSSYDMPYFWIGNPLGGVDMFYTPGESST